MKKYLIESILIIGSVLLSLTINSYVEKTSPIPGMDVNTKVFKNFTNGLDSY